MNPIIIACKTIEQELLASMKEIGCEYPILWLESGLHNWPDKLRNRIQELLDGCEEFDTVLLAMSFCGNSVVGLKTQDFQLIIPRSDDCITLLLGSVQRRKEAKATYFLTEGWLKGELNLWKEYQNCLAKYGEKRGKRIFSALLAHYRNLALVDTGCFHRETLEKQVRQIASVLGLEYLCLEGTLGHLQQLLTGPWEEDRFVLIPPHSTVTADMCTLKG